MLLEAFTTPNEGHILYSKPSPSFLIDIYVGPKNYKAFSLVDFGASIYFLDENFHKRYNSSLI